MVSVRARSRFAIRIFLAASVALPALALAHAHLEKAVPAPDSKTADVHELHLAFSEAVEAKLCTVTLETGEERRVTEPAAEAVAGDPKALAVHLFEALAPGVYKVQWAVVAADGHRMKGSYSFLVSR